MEVAAKKNLKFDHHAVVKKGKRQQGADEGKGEEPRAAWRKDRRGSV